MICNNHSLETVYFKIGLSDSRDLHFFSISVFCFDGKAAWPGAGGIPAWVRSLKMGSVS